MMLVDDDPMTIDFLESDGQSEPVVELYLLARSFPRTFSGEFVPCLLKRPMG